MNLRYQYGSLLFTSRNAGTILGTHTYVCMANNEFQLLTHGLVVVRLRVSLKSPFRKTFISLPYFNLLRKLSLREQL